MSKFWLSLCCLALTSTLFAQESILSGNRCAEAIRQLTEFEATGIYGSSVEHEWAPASMYLLQREAEKYRVLHRHFLDQVGDWRFEILEMKGGKTMMFVFSKNFEPRYCEGPNAFFVKRNKQKPIAESRAQVSNKR
jgi:hypothetical protein